MKVSFSTIKHDIGMKTSDGFKKERIVLTYHFSVEENFDNWLKYDDREDRDKSVRKLLRERFPSVFFDGNPYMDHNFYYFNDPADEAAYLLWTSSGNVEI